MPEELNERLTEISNLVYTIGNIMGPIEEAIAEVDGMQFKNDLIKDLRKWLGRDWDNIAHFHGQLCHMVDNIEQRLEREEIND